MNIKVITWNTGRTYTVEGQRCAACVAGDGVLFVDYDRMIEYFIPNCPLDRTVIMSRYDRNENLQYRPEDAIMDIDTFTKTRQYLIEMALAHPKVSYIPVK